MAIATSYDYAPLFRSSVGFDLPASWYSRSPFEHRVELADHVRVAGAELTNGLLSIDLVQELPEAMKPRKIEIQTNASLASKKSAP